MIPVILALLLSILNTTQHWAVIDVHGFLAVCDVTIHAGQAFANGCFR